MNEPLDPTTVLPDVKLHSPHLNPFQSYPERALDTTAARPRGAVEDNLSRAVFTALGNANGPAALALFLRSLATSPHSRCSDHLRERTRRLADAIQAGDPEAIEIGLQSWPEAALRHRPEGVLLVGISSSHRDGWTHDQRPAPESARPDAWVHVPGKVLVVFECKNDENPLDATQMSAYAHALGLLKERDNVPRAAAGSTLASADEARLVQQACSGVVLDVPWTAALAALRSVRDDQEAGERGRWLCGQAATYLDWHLLPPYRGVQTILDWLSGPDTPDRRAHLRVLVEKLAMSLCDSATGRQGAVTFAVGSAGKPTLRPGAGSAVYADLMQDGKPVTYRWLNGDVAAVLWFSFAQDAGQPRIGLEYYRQASGSDAPSDDAAWDQAADRHLCKAAEFERSVVEWVPHAPPGSKVIVSAVRLRGESPMWRNNAVEAADGPNSGEVDPCQALDFLRDNRVRLWAFPKVGTGASPSIREARALIRKPALSLVIPLDVAALAECGTDGGGLQAVLRSALAAPSDR